MFKRSREENAVEGILKPLEAQDPREKTAFFDMRRLSDDHVKRIVAVIKTNPYLIALNLNECGLQEKHIPALAEAIKENKTITYLAIQCFDNYDAKTKVLVTEMQKHVERNAETQERSATLSK